MWYTYKSTKIPEMDIKQTLNNMSAKTIAAGHDDPRELCTGSRFNSH